MTDQPNTAIPGVPDEAVQAAANAICVAVGGPCFAQEAHVEQARAALAAAVPHVREAIAREIENRVATGGATRDYWRSPQEIKADAAAIARGDSR